MSAPLIIVECGVCGEKYIPFTSAWFDHGRDDAHKGRPDWRACEQTVIEVPTGGES